MNVHKLKNNQNKSQSVNLGAYLSQAMVCPVTGKSENCYFVPLSEIISMSHNPGRASGTQSTNAQQIMDSMVTDPNGQIEPICLEWSPHAGQFSKVFGYHRAWAVLEAYNKGLQISNHPICNNNPTPGIWAWIFTGNLSEKTAIQMRENGNKTPHSAATKDEIVALLSDYISQGGLDKGYKTPYSSLNADDKYSRARSFMKKNTPFWAGRRFKSVWNKLLQTSPSVAAVNFTNYPKDEVVKYFCNNNPFGIVKEDIDCQKSPSGAVVEKNGIKYGLYFFTTKSEFAGALPANAIRMKNQKAPDKIIVCGCVNGNSVSNIDNVRDTICNQATDWNSWSNKKCFDEIYFLPQTSIEKSIHLMSGGWAKKQNF